MRKSFLPCPSVHKSVAHVHHRYLCACPCTFLYTCLYAHAYTQQLIDTICLCRYEAELQEKTEVLTGLQGQLDEKARELAREMAECMAEELNEVQHDCDKFKKL